MTSLHTATIRGRREALGLTQKQAAKLAGVTEPTWQRFETGGKKVAPYLARRRKEPTAIRILRDGWGITQETAAELANVPKSMWQKFEAGEEIGPACTARCMRLVNGEIQIPASAPRKRTPKEAGAMIKNPHRFTPEEAQAAGKKGGEPFKGRSGYMAELGRKGGAETQRRRRENTQ